MVYPSGPLPLRIITTWKDPQAATVLVPDFARRSSKRSNGNGRQHAVDNSVPGNLGEDLIDEEGSGKHRLVRDPVSRRFCPSKKGAIDGPHAHKLCAHNVALGDKNWTWTELSVTPSERALEKKVSVNTDEQRPAHE